MNEPTLRAPDWPRCARCTKPCKPSEQVVHEGKPYCCPSCVVLPEGATSQATLRAQVFARDHGVCVLCSLDVAKIETEVAEAYAARRNPGDSGHETFERLWEGRVAVLDKCGFDRVRVEGLKSLWEADHIEPRVRGGATTIANARTLCLPCHRSVTAELARDRAALRRPPVGHERSRNGWRR